MCKRSINRPPLVRPKLGAWPKVQAGALTVNWTSNALVQRLSVHWATPARDMFFYSSDEGHLDCFYFLALINNAAMNICVQVVMQTHFYFLGLIPQSAIAESYGISVFNLLMSYYLLKGLHYFTHLPAIYESSNIFTSLLTHHWF